MKNIHFESWISKHFDGLSSYTLYQFALDVFSNGCKELYHLFNAKADKLVYETLYDMYMRGINPLKSNCKELERLLCAMIACDFLSISI